MFFLRNRRPPNATRTGSHFPYTARFRSAERQRRAKLAAGAGIFAADGGLHVVAADVEAWNRGALRVQHPGMDVGAEAAAGAERRRQHGDGIEWRLGDRAQAGVDRKSTRLNSSH